LKVALTGITGTRNRGVEAIIVPTIEQLRQRNPDLNIDLLSWTPDYDKIQLRPYGVNVRLEKDYIRPSTRERWLSKILPGYKLKTPLICTASTAIVTGGDLFGSDYGLNSIKRHLRPLEIALDAGVPVVFLAQSIGPFKTEVEAELWLSVARRAKFVSVRESLSYKYVTTSLGLSESQVKLTADPAFLLEIPESIVLKNLFDGYGLNRNRPVIAVAASNAICRYSDGDNEKHLLSWEKVIHMIINELEADVLLIPHVQEVSLFNNDRFITTELLRKFDFDPRIKIAGAEHTASEFKGLISCCEMVIGERMHSCFAGLSSGICTVAVGYSVKAEGVMTDLFGTDYVENGLLIPVQDFIDPKKACESIKNAWNSRVRVVETLQKQLPQFKQAAAAIFDLIL
jgi:colanic acid/amylovoran biosynthesis protein